MAIHKRPGRWRTTQSGLIRARQLRHDQTAAENRLWAHLRGRALAGYKFRRQHPVGQFITDFCCVEARLIVEVDGGVHTSIEHAERDVLRDAALIDAGYRVVHYTNLQIAEHMEAILTELRQLLSATR